jgi:predicted metalloenzyme YecM
MKTEGQFRTAAVAFLECALARLNAEGFLLEPHWHIDHICLRTSTADTYNRMNEQLSQFATLLAETPVNGRMISTFKLGTPLTCQGWEIDLVEVPAPKAGKQHKDGFEHFEIVSDLSFAELSQRYASFALKKDGLNKDFNPELEFFWDSFAVKFHSMSLESVIRVEENHDVISKLHRSKVLSLLRGFDPLLVGTFPLNLAGAGSDVDILIDTRGISQLTSLTGMQKDVDTLSATSAYLENCFSHFDHFDLKNLIVDGRQTLVARFLVDGLPFELFGQPRSTVCQEAFKHFLVEERVLKFGGQKAAHRIASQN